MIVMSSTPWPNGCASRNTIWTRPPAWQRPLRPLTASITRLCWPIFACARATDSRSWPIAAENHPEDGRYHDYRIRYRGIGRRGDSSRSVDFLTKPLIDEELELAIDRALNQQKVIEENINLKAQLDMRFGMENIIGSDRRMLRIYDMVDSIADTKTTVLITRREWHGQIAHRAGHTSSQCPA